MSLLLRYLNELDIINLRLRLGSLDVLLGEEVLVDCLGFELDSFGLVVCQ